MLKRPMRRQISLGFLGTPHCVVWCLAGLTMLAAWEPRSLYGQRVLLFEDFESVSPGPPHPEWCSITDAELEQLRTDGVVPPDMSLADICIGVPSVDTYNRSRVVPTDNSLATVTGGAHPDPFAPGANQSLVLSNPNQATQMAVNFFSIFPDDEAHPNYYLKNGVIQFDVYMKTPQPNSLFTFLDIRFGFQDDSEDRNQVTTEGDQVIWNVFNLFGDAINDPVKAQIARDVLLSRREPQFRDNLFDQANTAFFVDPAEISGNPDDGVIVAERAIRVRYELTRTATTGTYRVFLDNLDDPDAPLEVMWPGGSSVRPWVQVFDFGTFMNVPAPGINEISFLTDASASSVSNVSQDVYIDNLLIIDNDQAPLDPDFDNDNRVDGDDFLRWQAGSFAETGATNATGDADGDGDVDAADFRSWQLAFGDAFANLAVVRPSTTGVPEPASLTLLVASMVIPLARRRNAFREGAL